MTSVLGVDYGMKRIGIATGNLETKIAFPREVVRNISPSFVLSEIKKVVSEWGIEIVVIGLPIAMEDDQPESPILIKVRKFYKLLVDEFPDLVVILFDERLSTFEANQLLDEMGANYKNKKNMRDAFAAQVILQRYFSTLT